MAETYRILLAGLNPQAEAFARRHLTQLNYSVTSVFGIPAAEEVLGKSEHDLAFVEAELNETMADVIRRMQTASPGLAVILVCADSTTGNTIDAFRAGALDVLILPLTERGIEESIARAAKKLPTRTPEGPEARLHYLDETGKERWVLLKPPRLTIGRNSTNDLVLPQMNISRAQAEIMVDDGEYTLRDLSSKHGTFLNGTRIEQTKLTHGDRVQLGGLQGQTVTFYQGDLLQSLLASSDSKPGVSGGLSISGFKEIGMLLSTFRALSSIPLLDDLLSLVVDTAIELTGAERGFIMLKDKAGELQFRCARNNNKRPLDGSSFQTSRRVPDEVFKTGRRTVINDLDGGAQSEDHATTRRLGLRSIFCVPLRYLSFHETGNMSGMGRMETIGVLYVDSQNIGAGLSNTQLDALDTLASEAAMAIYNARLYKESQEKRKMDEELKIAREIQQALLPQSGKVLPFVCAHSHNIPCHEVGGDYFDYFEYDDGRLGFALGDVAGKGTPAALLTSMLQGIFSAQTLLDLPIPAILSNVNKSLVKRGTGNRFVTFFFGVLEPNGHCTYTNAGHNPPFVVRCDGGLEELTEGGMVLGLFGAATYTSGTVDLQPGDHLVLFTDGVVEARDTKGDEFGESRLRRLLEENCRGSALDILGRLQQAIATFSAGTPQHDDITMMVLGYQEAAASTSSSASTSPSNSDTPAPRSASITESAAQF